MSRSVAWFILFATIVLAAIALATLSGMHLVAQREPVVGFKTPQAVFDAYAAAQSKGDWKTTWECLTPQAQDLEAVEAVFGLAMHSLDDDKYFKPGFNKDEQLPEGAAESEESEAEQQQQILSMLRDKFTVYAAACDFKAKNLEPDDWTAPLRKLQRNGDRAQGVIMRYQETRRRIGRNAPEEVTREPWEMPIYFQKTNQGWLLDVPTAAEQQNYVRELEVGE